MNEVRSSARFSESAPSRLLVFTLGGERERRRRRLLPAGLGHWERQLYRRCLDGALEAGRQVGCELVVSSPVSLPLAADVSRVGQSGAGFGARLADAVERSGAADGESLLIVGTDAPDLSAAHLRQALHRLEERPERVVLGPSPDGGIYLLAARRPVREALETTRWCCRGTLRSLISSLEALGLEVDLLPPVADLDRRADLESWLGRPRQAGTASLWGLWRASLRRILAVLRRPLASPLPVWPRSVLVPVRRGRAPPSR